MIQPRTRRNPFVLWGQAFKAFTERISGANRWKTLGLRPTTCIRPGDFFCDGHWTVIEESQTGPDPIHASAVILGLAIWCYGAGFTPGQPVSQACCKIDPDGWGGVVERSRTNFWAERLK